MNHGWNTSRDALLRDDENGHITAGPTHARLQVCLTELANLHLASLLSSIFFLIQVGATTLQPPDVTKVYEMPLFMLVVRYIRVITHAVGF